jgi:hypothetical protein
MPDKKVTRVRSHPLHVPKSKKNPTGITIRRAHKRNINLLNTADLKKIFETYLRKGIIYPAKNRLSKSEFPDADQYDDLIAVWCDYYNKLFPPLSPNAFLDPNVMKALIGSESDFLLKPNNPKAIGIAQITPATWKILQNVDGELKDHLFRDIRQKDLMDPIIAIPVATRWIFRKRELAQKQLGRNPTPEEIILEYKGLLKSKSDFKASAVKKFRRIYAKLS